MIGQAVRENVDRAVDALMLAEYKAGFNAGLAVAEKIVAWLSQHPDTKGQRLAREWGEKAIAKARELHE